MKTLFANICRVIKLFRAAANLAVQSHLEYRLNFFIDACLQPLITAGIEMAMWYTIFKLMNTETLAGFPKSSYMAYMLWGSFFSRVTSNWYYEFRMVEEIESGSINAILTRPFTFFEFYCGQFIGYKAITAGISFLIPLSFAVIFKFSIFYERMPLAFLLMFFYLFFLYSLSFLIASLAFYFTRVASFTVTKNMLLWILSGEIFPLDILPVSVKAFVIALPFASSCYIPVGYLTGRVELAAVYSAFGSITVGLLLITALGAFIWRRGVRIYSGTGA